MKMRIKMWHAQQKKMFPTEELAQDQMTLLSTGEFISVAPYHRDSVVAPVDILIPLHSTLLSVKNGELYEGDVIIQDTTLPHKTKYEQDGTFGLIVWADDWAGFAIEWTDGDGETELVPINDFNLEDLTIVGSEYEGKFE